MRKFVRAARRAVATFVFATVGVVGTLSALDDVAMWKVALGTGVGALLNLAYRWSEAVLREPPPVDVPGGEVV